MARSSTPKGPTPVESIRHEDKRTNIPTADAAGTFFDEPNSGLPPLLYPRDPSLDPQLVWRGKDAQDREDLVVDAPPIYIQEKIDPRVLVENLRKTAAAGQVEPELTLFDHFDDLPEIDAVEFYQHDMNWKNRMILGDSLQVMGSLAEREQLRGKVQMIYIDPPYGIKFGSNWQVSARKRDVKDGKLEDAAREAEQIKAFRDTWELGIHSYLSYLRDRLVVARDLLTESGSVFLQIGDENVHLVRSLMDEVFGAENYVSQIIFRKKLMPLGAKTLERMHDHILWFAKSLDDLKYRQAYVPTTPDRNGRWTGVELADGTRRRLTTEERQDPASVSTDVRLFGTISQWAPSYSDTTVFEFEFEDKLYRPAAGQSWVTTEPKMRALASIGRLFVEGDSPRFVSFHDDFPFRKLTNPWHDTAPAGEATYVVQTNPEVIKRCMLMATDPGDLVLDPTCGSGTTSFVAEQWGRRWITVDTSRVALALARQRLMGGRYPYYLLSDSAVGRAKEAALSGTAIDPSTAGGDIRHGFVYERVQHVTLKSIVNNPDIREGMTRAEIDVAIKRHAEFEVLYDKPYEDKSKVRVSGPFTVESLSPHRSLSFDEIDKTEPASERAADEDADTANFEQSILDNLQRAGIQNGRKTERIQFASLGGYAGSYVQAIGERRHDDEDTAPSHVAIAIGPQYGTVSPGFIKAAAKEAIADKDVDLLCVLGFAFDPQATGVTEADGVTIVADEGFAQVEGERTLGRIRVLLVRMNADLLMGEELKKTGAGNLFTVFGEPDIDVVPLDDDQFRVDLRGVDVYDPTTSEVRSAGTDRIALWMIDTDYNEESFFVRHCYFTGGNDPYKKLKTALKSDIDADAWAALYRDSSLPFPRPSTGRIAVKVINDYGDEVMKIIDIP
ncbi:MULTISPECIES: site-specific DNA-methyltransferase [Microbacterium]|uniref:site-specific DNA-methyltransferase n=1 Tax=Microbacterium TaxID=33882 RepID=UPI00146E83CC|nr:MULTISPECIES: site-specific DNA-methyltransferase [Microbacterium]